MKKPQPEARPNVIEAANLCKHLLEATEAFRESHGDNDPEGRTLSLGVTMFAGTFMACVPESRRQEMCDAMQGYALNARATLQRLM